MGNTFSDKYATIAVSIGEVLTMDMQKIGRFLAELRKDKALTQEELGEQLGVTNKTVSRWENGNYLPPVEILQMLSNLYDVSINELLSGERLDTDAYKEKAEENIVTALHNSTADLPEKVHKYKSEWLKKHWVELLIEIIALFSIMICGAIFDETHLLECGSLFAIAFALLQISRKNNYVFKKLYEEKLTLVSKINNSEDIQS